MFQALIGTVGTEKFLKYLSVVKKEFKKVNNKKRAKKQ